MSDRTYSLLFVEDELREKPYLTLPLENAGFAVTNTTTGLEAITLLKRNRYDAMVLDIMMAPGGEEESDWSYQKTGNGIRTGLSLLRAMAKLERPQRPPVWVLTALPDRKIEQEAKEFDFVKAYLHKPYSLPDLAQEIRDHLSQ